MASISHIVKVFNTVKYLKFRQVFYRLYYRFKSVSVTYPTRVAVKSWTWSGPHLNPQSIFSELRVRFLNEDGELTSEKSWSSADKSKLWLYNLHYFDDLTSRDYAARSDIHKKFIDRWISDNPPCYGNGWEPYPISLRVVNWIKWLSHQKVIDEIVKISLHQQAQALSKQVEYHILGNHVFANAKALIFCGCFLTCTDSSRFLKLGIQLLKRELKEQFLDDGGHFELSPMYHSILLWDVLELIELSDITQQKELLSVQALLKEKSTLAIRWLETMTHPDGEISFFNDSSFGIARSPIQIKTYAEKLGLVAVGSPPHIDTKKETGYTSINQELYKLIIDHGNVGPDYLPGHAHADTLSFELSVFSRRLFVNSGTSRYGTCSERNRQRQTKSHNTVVISGVDSSQVWAGFRVANRAYGTLHHVESNNGKTELIASHNGYRFLKPKQRHTRKFICEEKVIEIKDEFSSSVEANAFYHLHPDIQIKSITDKCVELFIPNEGIAQIESDFPIRIEATTWHPEFGVSIKNLKLVVSFAAKQLNTKLTLKKGIM